MKLDHDSKYLSETLSGDTTHHDYRNSGIEIYKESALYLAEKGYFVIRMGKMVDAAWNFLKNLAMPRCF